MMQNTRKFFLLCVLALCGGVSQAQKAEPSFLTVDGKPYFPKDFFNSYFEAYLKAENKSSFTPESFIDRFADNVVQLNQAKAQGIDTTSILRAAVANYTRMNVEPYLLDRSSIERLARQAADRAKEDIRVSHILVPVSRFAFEKDSLAAKARIDSVYAAIKAGTPFDTLAVRMMNGDDGDLGFITVFQLPYAMETAAYGTSVGEISAPVRTNFGYHVVRPVERRPARGLVELAHIMVMRKGSDSLDREALAEIKEAYSRLKKGEDFAQVAMNYTEDASTQASGGYLGFYGIGELIPQMEDLVFEIEPGGISSVMATPTNWEIVKVISKVQNDDYSARKDYLEKRVVADARYVPFQEAYAKDKLSAFPLKVNQSEYDKVVETLSNMGFLFGQWRSELITNGKNELFTLGDSSYVAEDFYNSLIYNMDDYGQDAELQQVVRSKFDSFVADMALSMYVGSLPEKDVKVRSTIEEFRNKSMIYALVSGYCQDRLSQADPDTLRAVYNRNADKYMWPERVHYQCIRSRDVTVAENIRKMMLEGLSYQEILSRLNKGLSTVADGYENTAEPSKVFKSDFEVKQGVSDIIQEDGSYYLFNILEIIAPARKTFEEAGELVEADFLDECAQRYTAELRKGHEVVINKKQLKSLAKAVAAEKKSRGIQ